MKNNWRHIILGTAAAFTFCAPAYAQIIEQGTLGAAQDFDAGALDFNSGGLDPALWQGTSAATAAELLSKAPLNASNPVVANMVRTVVLTAGVPPTAKNAAASQSYNAARLRALMALGDPSVLDNVVRRSPELASDPAVRADLALAAGDVAGACTMADSITEGRSTPTWARLRAFCHITRGEIPAAELTVKLLRGSDYEDAMFYGLMNRLTGASSKALPETLGADPLYSAMADAIMTKNADDETPMAYASPGSAVAVAKDPTATRAARYSAIFSAGARLTDAEVETILNGLIYDGVSVDDLQSASEFDLATAIAEDGAADERALAFAQLYTLAKRGEAVAAIEVLERAEMRGALPRFARLLKNDMAAMPAAARIEAGLKMTARVAVMTDDIITLQALFSALPDGMQKNRIAFAADAIGNGFRLGTLGRDIEDRLQNGEDGPRALRDAMTALALGSTLTDGGSAGLAAKKDGGGRAIPLGDLAVLRASAKASSRAETTLRAAIMLNGSPLRTSDFAAVVEALMDAQLTDFAGQVAGLDFLAPL